MSTIPCPKCDKLLPSEEAERDHASWHELNERIADAGAEAVAASPNKRWKCGWCNHEFWHLISPAHPHTTKGPICKECDERKPWLKEGPSINAAALTNVRLVTGLYWNLCEKRGAAFSSQGPRDENEMVCKKCIDAGPTPAPVTTTPTPTPPQTPPEEGGEGDESYRCEDCYVGGYVCKECEKAHQTKFHSPPKDRVITQENYRDGTHYWSCHSCNTGFSDKDDAMEHACDRGPFAKQPSPLPLAQTLQERGETHGPFVEQASMSQRLKENMRSHPNWGRLSTEQREALEMIAHKMSRVVCGNADHSDHWLDISGYATLAERSLGGGK
jgi:hypothetical protein